MAAHRGFELGEVLLEVNLKAALAGAELLIGLSVQSMVITLAVIAVLLWVERGCFSPLIPYSRVGTDPRGKSMVISGDNPDLIFRSGTTGEPLPPQYGQAGLRFTSDARTSSSGLYSFATRIFYGFTKYSSSRTRHVKGRLSLWLPVLITLVVVVLVSRVVVFITDVLSSKCVAGLTLSHYSAREGSPLVSNAHWLSRVAFVPWFRVDACLLGLLFYLTHIPGGLSLRTKRRKEEFCP